jgi:putative MFS transporter
MLDTGETTTLSASEPSPARRPGWARSAWFLGRAPGHVSEHQWRILGLVSLVSLFDQYDVYLFSLNLKHIQADLGLAEASLGWLGGFVRAGTLLAILVTLAADRVGRRRVLLVTVVAYTLLTGATAFAPNTLTFVALQFASRIFAVAESQLAVVVIAEEFAPANRGWAIGALGAIQACGAGLAALLFAFVGVLPFGWRSLYLVGLVPLALVAWWRRKMPETARFESLARDPRFRIGARGTLAPLLGLVRDHPGRFLAVAAVSFAFSFAQAPALFFAPKYLQDVHGWGPGGVAALNLIGGGVAIVANPLGGRLSDRIGRKPVTIAFALAWTACAIAFYRAGGPAVGVVWAAMLFAAFGLDTTFSASSVELFPTSQRSTAAGGRSLMSGIGAVAGLAAVSLLYARLQSNWLAISAIALSVLAIPPVVALFFPETARRALEEVAPERAA